MVKIIEGNLLKADVDIIIQQVNCMGVMGAGLAKQIKDMYPEVYKYYKDLCNKEKPENLLSRIQSIECHNGRYVINIFGQLKYGRDKQYTDYDALHKGLSMIKARAKQYEESVGIPYELGCGLAGGDWNVVYKIINDVFGNYDKVTIYKFKK